MIAVGHRLGIDYGTSNTAAVIQEPGGRERGEWGARPEAGTGTRIIVGYDHERFLQTMMCGEAAQRLD
ncbi:hypothetical protein [Dactylosporangium sp. NPDC049140]|uniref:hypothetical protein n=1 Tax=Dactylosporangium sp. NPDC049140 TaxID=3155647 RepID=UPI0033E39B75